MVENDDGTRMAVPVEELDVICSAPTTKQKQDNIEDDENQNAKKTKSSNR